MEEKLFGFEKLEAYKKSRFLVKEICNILNSFPIEERFALCNQMRRAVISIPSNIAEGMGRYSIREQIHFLEIAYGSLLEIYSQLQVSLDLGYISTNVYDNIRTLIFEVGAMIIKLRELRINKINEENTPSNL